MTPVTLMKIVSLPQFQYSFLEYKDEATYNCNKANIKQSTTRQNLMQSHNSVPHRAAPWPGLPLLNLLWQKHEGKELISPILLFFVFTRGQFWPSGIVVACVCVSVCPCVRVCQSRACPHDNSSLVQARITKFGTKVQKTLVKVPIVFGDDRPWPSRSNLTWKSNFTSFWACPLHNSSAVHARITKFGPKMHLSTVKIPINFGQDWFWSSLSFSILKLIFVPNLFALCLYYI